MILRLVLKNLRHERMRFAVAVFGVGAACGLLTWSLGLSMTTAAQSRIKVARMSAPFDCWLSTSGVGLPFRRGAPPPPGFKWSGAPAGLPPALLEEAAAFPGVTRSWACATLNATLDYRPDGRVMQGPPMSATLSVAPAAVPYSGCKVLGRWPDPASSELEIAVCTSIFTPRRLQPPPLGSTLVLLTPAGTVNARISAIIELPQVIRGFPTVFATIGVMHQAAGGNFAMVPDLLLCQSGPRFDLKAFKHMAARHSGAPPDAAAKPEDSRPPISAVARSEVEVQFSSDALQNFKRQAPLLLTLAFFTGLCMLVNALNVGVEQKMRVLALLRANGMTVAQVLRLVMAEGTLIAACGWLAGLLGGAGLLGLFVRSASETFPEGLCLGWQTPIFSGLFILVIALLSFYWPCRRAGKVRPLDALGGHLCAHTGTGSAQTGALAGISGRLRPWLGLMLLFPMLLLALPWHISAQMRSALILILGLPLHVAGLILFVPAFVRVIERFCAPAVGRLLALDTRLLRARVTRQLGRSVGMVLTLAVGLGSFVAIHIWGSSLTKPFIPSPEFPDAIVSILPNGIAQGDGALAAPLPGVADGKCLAIEARQFEIAPELVEQVRRVSGRAPLAPNVLLWGVEPLAAFGGAHPLARFRLLAGTLEEAAQALAQGQGCIITRMFARESGLGVGDELRLKHDAQATFRVAAIADLNWHMVSSRAQMRGRHGMSGMTMGPVFVSEAAARRLSGNHDRSYFLWLNLSEEYRRKGELAAGQALEKEMRAALAIDEANTVRVHHRDEIADGTIAHGAHLIGDMARAPFWSLVVLSSGIVTLLIASFQAAAPEFRTMRALGMTRSQLGRVLLGETLIIALGAILLSILTGFCVGWTFTGWTRAWMSFGGLPLSLEIPWLTLAHGVIFALALCLLMAAAPIAWLVRRLRQ